MTDQHPTEELLVALALDDLTTEQRDETVRHLDVCASCRVDYDAIAGTIDRTLPAAPVVEPPPGFDASVLAVIGGASAGVSRGRSRSRVLLLAAAVVVGIVLGALGAVLTSHVTTADAPARHTANSVSLRTADGDVVGSVAASEADGEPVVVVSVTRPDVDVVYRCVLRLSDGHRRPTKEWSARTRDGWTWVVAIPGRIAGDVVGIELVTAGRVWSSATLAVRPW